MTAISSGDVVTAYKRYAPVYDFLFGKVLEQGRKRIADEVCRLTPGTLLEVGVGTGLLLSRYPADAEIVGVDVSREMLDRAREAASILRNHKITLHEMDGEHLGFEDGSFDLVTVPYVLSVTPDPARFMDELRRVCKPNGYILVANHFSGQRGWRVLEAITRSVADRIGFRSEFNFDQHVPHPDWTIEKVEEVNMLGLSRLVVIRNGK
ncbi:class I SAM-dependent methyltransferase [Pseudoxanthomonas koreensis]|uniref:class I SAM-dependent methyltransferase n=1 Tax=Pseudoxanthomonas koreensis TaxID=266061 RepID=UPI0035A6FE61